jgi:hypothetical protein
MSYDEDDVEAVAAHKNSLTLSRLLGELLLLQHWAGGNAVEPHRVFGLINGFESCLENELEEMHGRGISRETQERVENLLEAIDHGDESAAPTSVNDWLRREGIDKSVAAKVMQLCRLQDHLCDPIEQVVQAPGSQFTSLKRRQMLPDNQWYGALHYVELVDTSGESNKKLHAVFTPNVPRIGEYIQPEGGQKMIVVDVGYVVMTMDDRGTSHPVLVPHVYLEPIAEDSSSPVLKPLA